jgi:Zn-dependent protease
MVAVIFHEVAHGYVALKLGDTTARDMGRLTLNPIPHIDPIGTIAIPLILILIKSPFLFGYARPVPVNFMRLRNPKKGMILVAAAGPATNLLTAITAAILIRVILLLHPIADMSAKVSFTESIIVTIVTILFYTLMLSVVLGLFNLTPIPPLDGGRIAVGLLPNEAAVKYSKIEPFGIFIVLGLLFLTPLSKVFYIVIVSIAYLLLGGEIFGLLIGG